MAAGPLDGFAERRAELVASAAPGYGAAAALADMTDEAVLTLVRAASSRVGTPFALFALGGYGARRLLPGSDIDVLVISRGNARDLEPLVRGVLYPLWDAGLEVGHQVRSPSQQEAAVREDLTIATSFLTARFIAGDRDLAARTLGSVFRRIRKDAPRLLVRIEERDRPGSPYLLEPDLKCGAGGQRDIDELVWRAAIAEGCPVETPDALLGAKLLSDDDLVLLREAQSTLTTARWLLHRTHGRPCNTLELEDADDPSMDDAAVQCALQFVHHTLLDVRSRAARSPEPASDPIYLRAIEELGSLGDAGILPLEAVAYARRLDHALPGFSSLMTLRRPGLSHRFTVGAHCLRTLTAALGADSTGPMLPESELQRHALAVAALAHDAGKTESAPGHSARGAVIAEAAAHRLGLGDRDAEMASALVREHLLLSEVAAARDLTDEDVVLEAAVRISDPSLVSPLFALTAADMRATADGVWTPWRAALVAELARKIETALSPNVDGAGIVSRAGAIRAEAIRCALAVGASRTQLGFMEQAPLRYLERRTAEEVLRDARLVQRIAGPSALGDVAISMDPGPVGGTWIVDVVARDRPGLFATVSGALALSGLGALSAEAFTDRTGIALDTFVVAPVTLATVDGTTRETLERTLRAALGGTLALDDLLAERRRHYRIRMPRRTTPPSVEVDESGAYHTAVRVRSIDRVGLLHDLARAFQGAGLDIRRATVATTSGIADDVFEVVDAYGQPPDCALLADTLVPSLQEAARAR